MRVEAGAGTNCRHHTESTSSTRPHRTPRLALSVLPWQWAASVIRANITFRQVCAYLRLTAGHAGRVAYYSFGRTGTSQDRTAHCCIGK